MKRMKPEAYKGEAHHRVAILSNDLVTRYGIWNATKIMEEIERLLREKRHEQSRFKTSNRPVQGTVRLRKTHNVRTIPEGQGPT